MVQGDIRFLEAGPRGNFIKRSSRHKDARFVTITDSDDYEERDDFRDYSLKS